MPDPYIDLEETQRYAHHFLDTAGSLVKRHPLFAGVVDHVRARTDAFATALDKAGETSRETSATARGKKAILPRATAALTAMKGWVQSFPGVDGTDLASHGESAGAVKGVLDKAVKLLGRHPGLGDATERRVQLEALAEELGASISAKAKALKGKIKATPALRQARAKWDEGYDAAKLVAEGLLVLDVGKAEAKKQLKGFFADLAVATRRKPKPEPGGGGASPPAKPLAP